MSTPKVLEVRSGADAPAIPEISHLTGEADQQKQALRVSIGSAHEIFRHLDGSASSTP